MGLTQKILLFTSLLVVALVATTLAFTTFQADRLARETIDQGLAETRSVWETFQADRYNKLKLGVRVLGNDPYFKAAVETQDAGHDPRHAEGARSQDLKADFFIATDPAGVVIARSDRPGGAGRGPLEGPARDEAARGRGVRHRLAAGRPALPRGLRADADRARTSWAC